MCNSVAMILLSECKKKVLLIKRRDVPVYALPGGGIESGESSFEAAIREMKEETGLDVSIERIVGYYYPVNKLCFATTLIECKKLRGIESPSDETIEAKYFDIHNLPKHLPPPYLDWINDTLLFTDPVFSPISSVTYKKFLFYCFKHPILILRFLLSRLKVPINTR